MFLDLLFVKQENISNLEEYTGASYTKFRLLSKRICIANISSDDSSEWEFKSSYGIMFSSLRLLMGLN